MKKQQHLTFCFLGFLVIVLFYGCTDKKEHQKEIVTTQKFKQLLPKQSGINFTNKILKEDSVMNPFSFFNIYNGGGVAIGDINNDGLPDIYFTGNQVENKLYLNKGDLKFEDITKKSNVAGSLQWTTGVTMVDINNDGWLDIYVCQSGGANATEKEMRNLLYINNQDLTFTESAKDYGVADGARSNHAAFFDYDNDGNLDLYVLNHPLGFGDYIATRLQKAQNPRNIETDKLFRNDGSNKFTEVTDKAGLRNYGFGLSITVSDFNNDGWSDLYVANDYSEPDHLYINNKDGTFKDEVQTAMKHISQFSMGSDAADINNDGLSDLFVVDMMAEDNKRKKTNMQGMDLQAFYANFSLGRHLQYMQNVLQLNRGNGQFSEIAELSGIANTDWSWSPLICDLDNDGWKDIYITNGIKRDLRNNDFQKSIAQYPYDYLIKHHKEIAAKIPVQPIDNYVYQNQKDLTFSKKLDWGLNYKGFSNGSAYADLDNDGDLDLVVNNLEAVSLVFENKTSVNNYLRIKLNGNKKNPFGIGAKVEIKTQNGSQYGELNLNHGFLSSSEPILHFGLGSETIIDELIITWVDGKQEVVNKIKANQIITLNYSEAKNIGIAKNEISLPITLTDITRKSGINFTHNEIFYEDYDREILLPHRYSQNGPFVTVGDVNNDNLEDFFVGGAANQSGVLFLQQINGKYKKATQQPWAAHQQQEDMGTVFIDIDGDKDLDIYVVSGSNQWEENSEMYQDRIYINDGRGNFKYEANRLPKITTSGGCVTAADFDKDGDIDLFIGGRITPGKYPVAPKSLLLINNNGFFTDEIKNITPQLEHIGMVTDALWADYDNDKDLDLVLTGEWMPITIFKNENGKLINTTNNTQLNKYVGWWYSISAGDFDNDGDVDFIAGNLGLNSKYQTKKGDLEVYAGDLDKNGTHDIILGVNINGKTYPLRGKTCSSQQMPSLSQKIPTYDLFGNSTLSHIYGGKLQNALHKEANWFASSYVENNGNGTFNLKALPNYAQLSVVNASLPIDINNDGNLDVIIGGNMYSAEIETARHDAAKGLILMGDGKGNFKPLRNNSFFADGDVKDMQIINGINQNIFVIIANNNTPLNLVKINSTNLLK